MLSYQTLHQLHSKKPSSGSAKVVSCYASNKSERFFFLVSDLEHKDKKGINNNNVVTIFFPGLYSNFKTFVKTSYYTPFDLAVKCFCTCDVWKGFALKYWSDIYEYRLDPDKSSMPKFPKYNGSQFNTLTCDHVNAVSNLLYRMSFFKFFNLFNTSGGGSNTSNNPQFVASTKARKLFSDFINEKYNINSDTVYPTGRIEKLLDVKHLSIDFSRYKRIKMHSLLE